MSDPTPDTWPAPAPSSDEPTDPGGHAAERAPEDLPATVDALTVARTYATMTARIDRLTAAVGTLTDTVAELLQAVRSRPCMRPPELPCPALRVVEGDG